MKLGKYFEFQKKLRDKLDDPNIIIGLAIDGNICLLTASLHKSEKYEFNHGKVMQYAQFNEVDLISDSDKILKTLVELFDSVLVSKKLEG